MNAVHSDFAETYIIVADGPRLNLVLPQVKRILGRRVEIITAANAAEEERIVRAFDKALPIADNVARMRRLAER